MILPIEHHLHRLSVFDMPFYYGGDFIGVNPTIPGFFG
jgi:hypothetical protein